MGRPGEGAGKLLGDIARGMKRDEIRRRYMAGEYGAKGERPRADYVAGWLELAGL